MESWFCIWDDLANPKIGLNLDPKTAVVAGLTGNGRKNNSK
jgi:hypothetical protein